MAVANGTRLHARRCRPRSSSLARSWIQRVTSVSAGPPLGGLYLKPPSSGGLCDGVMTMPSAKPLVAAAVVDQNRVRDDRRRRHAVVALDDGLDAVGREHFERGALGRTGQRVRVLAQAERAVDFLAAAVIADGLGDGQDMGLGERAVQRTNRGGRWCRS